jgi:hypothetical protein
VEKTTVYLTRELKKRLRARARARGVSEAQLIREGLDAVLAPRPTFPLFDSGDRRFASRVDEHLADMGMDSLPREMRKRLEKRRAAEDRTARPR